MANIWLTKREIRDFKKRKQCIHDVLFPVTKISNPLTNCVIWESKTFLEGGLAKHEIPFLFMFIRQLSYFPTAADFTSSLDEIILPSFVKFDFTYGNKVVVTEDGDDELWNMSYEDKKLITSDLDVSDLRYSCGYEPVDTLCCLLAQECAYTVRKDIISDIDLIKNNNIIEYNYYINSIYLTASEKGYDFNIRYAKSVILGN